MKKGYKECPFCANEIKEGAKKCQYCHEFLDADSEKVIDKKPNKTDVTKGHLTCDKNQLESCIKTSKKRRSWGWLSILGLILIIVMELCMPGLSGKDSEEATRFVGMIVIALFGIAIYFLVWLVKNYRVLINSKIEGLTCKSSLLLLVYWICPVLNLFKPQKTIEDLLGNYLSIVGESYDKKLVKIRGILRDITLISLCLAFCYPVRLSAIAIVTYIIGHSAHIYYLIKIIDKIIFAQEKYLKDNN